MNLYKINYYNQNSKSKYENLNKVKKSDNKKIAILFHGMAGRSLNYTWEKIQENLIDVLLDNDYNVDIFMHTWLSRTGKFIKFEEGTEYSVDVDNKIYNLIPCKKYLAEYQEDIGDITYRSNGITKDKFYNTFIYTMRLYKTIDQVTKLMEEEEINYDAVFIMRMDLYFPKKLDITEVEDVIRNKNLFYNQLIDWYPRNSSRAADNNTTVRSSNVFGIGDSYILSSMKIAHKWGRRFSYMEELMKEGKIIDAWWIGYMNSYNPFTNIWGQGEIYLGYVMDESCKWKKSSMIYAKLRSNKTFNWAISHVLKDLTPEELNKHNEWKKKHNIF